MFLMFTGYNVPEASKHRKRSLQNMSSSTLQELSDTLFSCLQCSYWDSSSWGTFKADIEMLASSLSRYSCYLTDQNKKMKNIHSSPHPSRQISDHLSFQFLPKCDVVDPLLRELDTDLSMKENYVFSVVEELCPPEPRKKYEYLERLKSYGLSECAALLTYSHGNNIGNIHFVWKVSNQSENAFACSLQTIESAKELVPTFHTRAMRRALMTKYGRVAPSMKPAIMRKT